MPDTSDDERVVVKTYVPPYQKRQWTKEADALGMNQSEYLSTMVQGGRRELELADQTDQSSEEPPSERISPGETALEQRILAVLSSEAPASWDELLERVSEDLEQQLETALDSLKQRGRIEQRPRGDFVLPGGENE